MSRQDKGLEGSCAEKINEGYIHSFRWLFAHRLSWPYSNNGVNSPCFFTVRDNEIARVSTLLKNQK